MLRIIQAEGGGFGPSWGDCCCPGPLNALLELSRWPVIVAPNAQPVAAVHKVVIAEGVNGTTDPNELQCWVSLMEP